MMRIKAHLPKPTLSQPTRFCLFAFFVTQCVLLVTLPVGAQENLRQLEEVIVSAQKREQSLQDVPISISAVSSEDIASINAFDFTEIEQLTPGVNINPGLQAGAIRLRGVGPGFFATTAPQSVAVFVDQFAQSQVAAVFSTLVDVERIELLRGPQGTLYGVNAPAGAYNITTASPDFEEVGGYLEASLSQFDSSDLARQDLRAAINLPLSNTLALRLAGVYSDDDGHVRIVNPNSPDATTGGLETQAIRSKLLWTPNESMELRWTLNYQDLVEYSAGSSFEGQVPNTGGVNPTPALFSRFEDRFSYGEFSGEVRAEVKDTGLHWSWDTDATKLELLAYYQEFTNVSDENREPYPDDFTQFIIDLIYELQTFEVRISDQNENFDYIAGLYYSDRFIDSDLDLNISGTQVTGGGSQQEDALAAYANVGFNLSEQWRLSLGVRYDDNALEVDANTAFAGFNAVLVDENEFDHVSWSVKLSYMPTDALTAYLAIDNSYKQGGFNLLVTGALPLEFVFPDIANFARDFTNFGEETSTAYEIGIKGQALDNSLRYSLALFYQEYDDHQVGQTTSGPAAFDPLSALFANSLVNADEVLTQGAEIELTWLFADYWDVSFRGAYFDATSELFARRFCPRGEELSPDQVFCPITDSDPLNDLPRWNSNMQIGLTVPMANSWELFARTTWQWQTDPVRQSLSLNQDPVVRAAAERFDRSRHRFGMTFGLRNEELGLSIRAWGKNLSDTVLVQNPTLFRNPGDPTQDAPLRGSHTPGREYGVTVRYDF